MKARLMEMLEASEILWLLCASGWAAADTTAAFQLMVSQPLVSGWIAGLILSQPQMGLLMGGALQMLWSRLQPMGAAAYPDVGPATIAGVAAAVSLQRAQEGHAAVTGGSGASWAILTGLLVALAAGRLGQALTVALRKDNVRLARIADRAAQRGSFAGVEWANALGALRSFGRGVAVLPMVLGIFWVLARCAASLTGARAARGPWDGSFGIQAFWWIGAASALSVLWRGGSRDWVALGGGALAAALAVWIL